jgi:hypothetical protein
MSFPRAIFACVLLSVLSSAQQKPASSVNTDFVQKQFGANCTLIGLAPITADLDADGIEDIVIPARCKSPMMDQAEDNYTVVDPYNSFFGYGNPRITTQFASEDPDRRGFSLLVIHGIGKDAWRSDTPKAKFMIVNVPFKDIHVKKLPAKKRERFAIYIDETGADAMTSAIFWDGKKYRYIPMGSSME